MQMTQRVLKIIGPWAFRAYIAWSICADLILITGVVWYFW
jgi:hypothetical protein